jgi:hypothetical protein
MYDSEFVAFVQSGPGFVSHDRGWSGYGYDICYLVG